MNMEILTIPLSTRSNLIPLQNINLVRHFACIKLKKKDIQKQPVSQANRPQVQRHIRLLSEIILQLFTMFGVKKAAHARIVFPFLSVCLSPLRYAGCFVQVLAKFMMITVLMVSQSPSITVSVS